MQQALSRRAAPSRVTKSVLVVALIICFAATVYIIYIQVSKESHDTEPSGKDVNLRADVPLPPMGWNSWNAFGCRTKEVNEKKFKAIIDKIVDSGLAAAGYKYFNIDDCWLDPHMTDGMLHGKAIKRGLPTAFRNGSLRADPTRFTDGSLATLADYAHSRGLQFGTYLDAGLATCQGYGGSFGHEEEDAKVLAAWKVDYLKMDGCYLNGKDAEAIYTKWSNQLQGTGRKIVFSCEYPLYARGERFPENFNWTKTQEICNLWRVYTDASARWESLVSIMDYWTLHEKVLRKFHGSNGYNDPDLLAVGNDGVTLEEGRTQMSVWAVLAAPLIFSNDVTKITTEELAVLTNDEVLAVNQDKLVTQGRRVVNKRESAVWVRPLHDFSVAIAVVNFQSHPETVEWCWSEIVDELKGMSQTSLMTDSCSVRVRDLWQRVDIGNLVKPQSSPCFSSTSKVSSHDTFFVRVWFDSVCFTSAARDLRKSQK